MNNLQPYYRSESCRQMLERAHSGHAYNSLKITIHIDQIINGSKKAIARDVSKAIGNQEPFVLYFDKSNYVLIVPKAMVIEEYKFGVRSRKTVCSNLLQFANNVKLAVVVYEKFMKVPVAIEAPKEAKLIELSY